MNPEYVKNKRRPLHAIDATSATGSAKVRIDSLAFDKLLTVVGMEPP
jgi:hypothetical protein